jgi:hypothetical protein
MPATLNTMEVVILTDKMPRSLTALVKTPGGTRTVTAHWDVAASQFQPAVVQGLSLLIEDIIKRSGVRADRS